MYKKSEVKNSETAGVLFYGQSLYAKFSSSSMFDEIKKHTDEGGVIYLPAGDNLLGTSAAYLRAELKYTDKALSETFQEAYATVEDIKTIYKRFEKEGAEKIFTMSDESASATLTPELYATWKKYLREIKVKGFNGEPIEGVSEKEKALWKKYMLSREKEAGKRVGKGLCCCKVIVRAQRLLSLYKTGPRAILQSETNLFIISMVLNRFAKSLSAAVPPKPSVESLQKPKPVLTYMQALGYAVERGDISVSSLQRRFLCGYARASEYVAKMLEDGFIALTDDKARKKVVISEKEYQRLVKENEKKVKGES